MNGNGLFDAFMRTDCTDVLLIGNKRFRLDLKTLYKKPFTVFFDIVIIKKSNTTFYCLKHHIPHWNACIII